MNGSNKKEPAVRWGLVVAILIASTAVSFGLLFQKRAEERWAGLPTEDGTLAGAESRLAALDGFIAEHPVWLGAQDALSERTELSTRIQQLRTEQVIAETNLAAEATQRTDEAATEQMLGKELATEGDMQGALEHFRAALEVAPEDWPEREQVARDAAAVEQYLAGEGDGGQR